MRWPRLRRRPLAGFVAVSALAVSLWQPGEGAGFWSGLEGRLLDARFVLRGPLPPPDDVAIVMIDDEDIVRLGAFPPPRDAIASAISGALDRGAEAVAVDLLLLDRTETDPALARMLDGTQRVVLAVGSATARASGPQLDAAIARSGFDAVVGATPGFVSPPLGPVPEFARAATLGHVNVAPEADAALRRMPAGLALATAEAEIWVPGLALAAVRLARPATHAPLILRGPGSGGRIEAGETVIPLDRFGSVPLVHYGARGAVPTIAMRDLGRAALDGRLVFLGLSATGAGDRHPNPFDRMLPGVEAHATFAANVLEGRTLRRDGAARLWETLLAVATALVTFAAAAGRPRRAAFALPIIGIATAGILHAAFLAGWWLDAVTVLQAFAIGALAGTAYQIAHQSRRATNLSRYHSASLVDLLAEDASPRFAGRSQQAIALFVDLEGFTGRSERLGAAGTADLLGDLHRRIAQAAERHGGVVEQIVGDGAMVLFGLPDPAPGDANGALAFTEEIVAEAPAEAPVRVGAHMGLVQVAVLGGDAHRHVTISGDTVNAASRLQEIAKGAGARIALSDTLLQQTDVPARWARRLRLRDMGPQVLRGREMRLHVWCGPFDATK